MGPLTTVHNVDARGNATPGLSNESHRNHSGWTPSASRFESEDPGGSRTDTPHRIRPEPKVLVHLAPLTSVEERLHQGHLIKPPTLPLKLLAGPGYHGNHTAQCLSLPDSTLTTAGRQSFSSFHQTMKSSPEEPEPRTREETKILE